MTRCSLTSSGYQTKEGLLMPMVIIPRWVRLIDTDVHPISDEGSFLMFGRHVEEVSEACIHRGCGE